MASITSNCFSAVQGSPAFSGKARLPTLRPLIVNEETLQAFVSAGAAPATPISRLFVCANSDTRVVTNVSNGTAMIPRLINASHVHRHHRVMHRVVDAFLLRVAGFRHA